MDNRPHRTGGSEQRMTRAAGSQNHHQQSRVASSMNWHGNNAITYQTHDETISPYQHSVINNLHNYSTYSQNLAPPEIVNPNNHQSTYTTYSPSPQCYLTAPPLYSHIDVNPTVFMASQTIPISTTLTPPLINTNVPNKKIAFNSREAVITCSKCHHRNSLLESELIKKEEEIARLQNENITLQNKIQQLQEQTQRMYEAERNISEFGPLESISHHTTCKTSELSPEAVEFSPKRQEVPVVSAKWVETELANPDINMDISGLEESASKSPFLKNETKTEFEGFTESQYSTFQQKQETQTSEEDKNINGRAQQIFNNRNSNRGHNNTTYHKNQFHRNIQKLSEDDFRNKKDSGLRSSKEQQRDLKDNSSKGCYTIPPRDTPKVIKDGELREHRESELSAKRWENRQGRYKSLREDDQSLNRDLQNDDAHSLQQFNRKVHRGKSNEDFCDRNRYSDKRNDSCNKDKSYSGNSWNINKRQTYTRNVIEEVQADLFSAPTDFSLAHCVAKDFRMGRGIAVEFKKRFKRVAQLLDQNVDVGGCAFLEDEENKRYIFYMVTKDVSSGKPRYEKVQDSLVNMREKCRQFNVTKLAIPHIACGLDRLDWSKIKQMINDVFQNDDVQVCAYEFNTEGLPEVEGNKPAQSAVRVKYHIMNLLTIDIQTALIFLGTEDGHMDTTANSLNTKFNFLNEYAKASKTVGKVLCFMKSKEYYIYSFIISKSFSDKVSFCHVEECCKEFNKQLKRDQFEYVGIESFNEWSEDDTFTEKIVTLFRGTLPHYIQLWVCYRDQALDVHNMSKTGKQTH